MSYHSLFVQQWVNAEDRETFKILARKQGLTVPDYFKIIVEDLKATQKYFEDGGK